MSSVIAMIYRNEVCLASDTKVVDHNTGDELEPMVKQTVINDEFAIGFAGSGNIAEVIIRTLESPKNMHIVSKLTLDDAPKVLDDIYQAHISKSKYPDEEMGHVSALMVGFSKHTPKIIRWDSSGKTKSLRRTTPESFVASVLEPYDIEQAECSEILHSCALKAANDNHDTVSLAVIAVNYFNTISSKSKFTGEEAVIWRHKTFGIVGAF